VPQINLRLPDELLAEVNRLRGLVSRERFLRAVILGFVEFYGSRNGFDVGAYVAELEDPDSTLERRALIARMDSGGASWNGFLRDMSVYADMVLTERHGGAILEQLHDAVIATDEHLVVRTWNSGAERLFGWTVEEALGQHARMLIHPSRPSPVTPTQDRNAIAEVRAGGVVRRTGTWTGRDPDRPVAADEVAVGLFEDGRFAGIAVVMREQLER
jgi:PAS domain-containing protein